MMRLLVFLVACLFATKAQAHLSWTPHLGASEGTLLAHS